MIKLFIDDICFPVDVGYENNSDFLIVRCPYSARKAIHDYKPQFIAFDHDLGEDEFRRIHKTGYDIAKWMILEDQDDDTYITKDFKFSCHSANPVGKKNIEDLLNGYIKNKFSLDNTS